MFPLSDQSRFAKLQRRQEALAAVPNLELWVHRVRVRDPSGQHITVWPGGVGKVQWWPGSGKWSNPGEITGTHRGTLEEFVDWLVALRHAAPDPQVIDMEDA